MAQSFTTAYQRVPLVPPAESAVAQPGINPGHPLRHCAAEISADLQRCSTLADLLQTATVKIGGAIAADVVAVSQRSSNGDECLRALAYGPGQAPTEVCSRSFRWAVGWAGLERSQCLNATALLEMPAALGQNLQLQQMDNGWTVPLWYNGQLWGHLMGFWRSPSAPQAVDIMAHLPLLAAQLMVGVSLIELQQLADYSQSQQRRLEQLLHR